MIIKREGTSTYTEHAYICRATHPPMTPAHSLDDPRLQIGDVVRTRLGFAQITDIVKQTQPYPLPKEYDNGK